MKLKSVLTISLFALGLTAARAQEIKVPSGQPAAAPAGPTFTNVQIIEELGWFFGKRVGAAELEFSPEEIAALVKGFTAAVNGKDSPFVPEQIAPKLDEFMQKKQAVYTEKQNAALAKAKSASLAATAEYFKKLEANKNIVTLPSGLRYEIIKPGEGAYPKPTDTVRVHYHGTLIDGKVFDSSVQRNEPAEFGLGDVIPGWTEGLQKINKGGKIKLYVPPQLAYGDDDRGTIPPSSTLIFEVDLLEIKSAAPAPAPAPAAKK